MEISDEIAKMVSARADSNEIEKKALEEGMMKMLEDGVVKALQGTTSIEEILRVTKD
jgi:general secretion pathway protein E